METKKQCENCMCDLDRETGQEAIKVTRGVKGLKGFVLFEESLYFCCEKCLIEYYSDARDLPKLPPRIP